MKALTYIYCCGFLLSPLPALAGEKITLQEEPIRIEIQHQQTGLPAEELATLTITITGNQATKIEAPLPPEESYSPLVLVSATLVEQDQKKQSATFSYQFLAPKEGEYRLKRWQLTLQQGQERRAFTIPEQGLHFLPSAKAQAKEGSKFKPEGPLSPRYQFWPFLVSLLPAGLLWMFLPKLLGRLPTEPLKPKKTPYEIALERLQALKRQNLLDKEEFELFYQELSQILREFLEFYMNLKALESTTEEFIQNLRSRKDLKAEEKRLLDQFLSLSDLVKFAHFAPDSSISLHTLAEIESFILRQGHAD